MTNDKNSKKLYTFIKGKKCDSSGISPLRKDGIAHSDPRTTATILNEQFSSVFTEETSVDMPAMSGSRFPDIHSFKVDQAGVLKLMHGLNPHKLITLITASIAQLVERPLSEREVVGSNLTAAPYQRCKKWYLQLPC